MRRNVEHHFIVFCDRTMSTMKAKKDTTIRSELKMRQFIKKRKNAVVTIYPIKREGKFVF